MVSQRSVETMKPCIVIIYQEFERFVEDPLTVREVIRELLLQKRELFGITRRKRLELCGLKRKWFAISSQIPYNSTKLLKEKYSNS